MPCCSSSTWYIISRRGSRGVRVGVRVRVRVRVVMVVRVRVRLRD